MKTLLLNHDSNVYNIVGEYTNSNILTYMCEQLTWCSDRRDYLSQEDFVELHHIEEFDVECIDTNTAIIVRAKERLMCFDDYVEL